MFGYPHFIPEFVQSTNSSLFWFKIANELSEFRNYLSYLHHIIIILYTQLYLKYHLHFSYLICLFHLIYFGLTHNKHFIRHHIL